MASLEAKDGPIHRWGETGASEPVRFRNLTVMAECELLVWLVLLVVSESSSII
jgi:hypothetical protein